MSFVSSIWGDGPGAKARICTFTDFQVAVSGLSTICFSPLSRVGKKIIDLDCQLSTVVFLRMPVPGARHGHAQQKRE
jgi:hypothetical protein